MQKSIEFFELNKDGTWFVVLIFVLVVIAIALLVHYGRRAIEDIRFYHKYGMTLSKYCFVNEISDRDWAKEVARRELENSKIIERLNTTRDFYIPPTGITMEEATQNMLKFSRVLNDIEIAKVRDSIGLPPTSNGGL